MRIAWGLIAGALVYYTVRWLPEMFFHLLAFGPAYLVVAFVAAGGSVYAVRRHTTPMRATAAGLAVLGGLIGLFWPAIEFLFQSIDGGGMLPYNNFVFGVSIVLSVVAIVGGLQVAAHPHRANAMLIVAAAGTACVGIFAPAEPPAARRELLLGLPFLAAAALASWLATRRRPS
jgi:hypothetical protein